MKEIIDSQLNGKEASSIVHMFSWQRSHVSQIRMPDN